MLGDEQLLTRAHDGDERACEQTIERFAGLAVHLTGGFYLQGGDTDDLRQEALIGITKAIRNWNPAVGVRATTFVTVCVRRHLLSCVKLASGAGVSQLTDARRTMVIARQRAQDAAKSIEREAAA